MKSRALVIGATVVTLAASLFPVPGAAQVLQSTHTLYRIGGIGCDGQPVNGPAGTVTLSRTESNLTVTINLTDDQYPSHAFSVEAWESAPGCYPDDALMVPGAGLTTGPSGSGSSTFSLPMPWTHGFPDGSTVVLGDGDGSEQLVLVLDRDRSTTGGGDTYGTGAMTIPGGPDPDPTPTPTPSPSDPDSDADGVPDDRDACPDSYPGYPVDGTGCARPLELDWTVPERFTGIPATTREDVVHIAYEATLKVSFPDGSPCDTSLTYEYRLPDEVIHYTGACSVTVYFDEEGSYPVEVHASLNRPVASGSKVVDIKDHLIVSIGDSVAAGEGNPPWQHEKCHRSIKAGPIQAALDLEAADDRSSVTMVHLACTGGTMDDILVLKPEEKAKLKKGDAQITMADHLIGARTLDALLISVGANDLEFAKLTKDCLKPTDCSDNPGPEPQRIAKLKADYLTLRTDVDTYLAPSRVFVTEYFNPLRDTNGDFCQIIAPWFMTREESEWGETKVVIPLNNLVREHTALNQWQFISGPQQDFVGHGYCTHGATRWVVNISESLGNLKGPFHPNEAGQRNYAEHIMNALRYLVDTNG